MENVTLYAYLNIDHPMVAWEVAIGRVKSSCDNNRDNFGVSLWQYSMLRKYAKSGATNRFINELKLEEVRKKLCPSSVSRLQGLYFFESESDAVLALDRWGMPEKKRFISAVNFSANKLTRVDSEWITHNLDRSDNLWMESYWGQKSFSRKPLIEVLGSGIGLVQNNTLRNEAYGRIMDLWPDSTPLLAAACCAFKDKHMEEIALVKPVLMLDGDELMGRHYIYMKDLDTKEGEVVEAVKGCMARGECPPFTPPNDGKSIFSVPDLRVFDFKFKNSEGTKTFNSIHNA